MRDIVRRAAHLLRRSRFERDLDEEIAFHIEARAAELRSAGVECAAALAQARREFGGASQAREGARSAWEFRWLEDAASDLRYAARALQ
jgi:hypothetical protein